jgi:hypothetical protein
MYLDEQMNALAQRGLITSQEDEQAVQDLLRSGNVEDATRTLCGCAPGQATVEIEILVDGCPLPTRDARGEGWKSGERWTYAAIAPAQESREFAVRVHNRTTRLLGVELSIDGAVQEGCRRWAVKPGEARVREGTSGRYYAHRRFKFDRARFIPLSQFVSCTTSAVGVVGGLLSRAAGECPASAAPLDESELDFAAAARGWEKLPPVSGSAPPMARYQRPEESALDRGGGASSLDFWLSTGAVALYVADSAAPAGRRLLFRRCVSYDLAVELFDDPQLGGEANETQGGTCPRSGMLLPVIDEEVEEADMEEEEEEEEGEEDAQARLDALARGTGVGQGHGTAAPFYAPAGVEPGAAALHYANTSRLQPGHATASRGDGAIAYGAMASAELQALRDGAAANGFEAFSDALPGACVSVRCFVARWGGRFGKRGGHAAKMAVGGGVSGASPPAPALTATTGTAAISISTAYGSSAGGSVLGGGNRLECGEVPIAAARLVYRRAADIPTD